MRIQARLARLVCIRPMTCQIQFVGGLDCSFDQGLGLAFGAAVVVDANDLRPVDYAISASRIHFPYVPGLLSFREAPAMLKAFKGLKTVPDLILVDGQGIAHPRRLGIASHIGILLDRPTIGCAKGLLIGSPRLIGQQKGDHGPIVDLDTGQVIGAGVRTRAHVRPLYVSPGHLCDLQDAIHWTIRCAGLYRIPEPLRLAHQVAGKAKRSYSGIGVRQVLPSLQI
jgi:deoxyribonuclease V